MTERLYRDDPYLTEFDARVVARREHAGRPAVVLDRTAFYAESGGQPWDLGELGGSAVLAVVDVEDGILHVVDRPLEEGARVHGRVDAERRRDHRQQHHGQHLLSRAFVETADADTISFHLGAQESTIDLDHEVDERAVRAAERRANDVVWEGRPVRVRVVSRAQAADLGVRVPEEAGDSVRLVEAEGFDLQACGGTHPRSTSEVGVVVVLGYERHKGGSRVRFVCGHRALDTVRAHAGLLRDLAGVLSSSLEDLPAAARRTLEALAGAEKGKEALLERAMEGEAHRLLAAAGPSRPAVLVATYEGWPAADLRLLAQKLVAAAPCVALLGSRADKAHLVFAQTAGLGHDVPGLLRQAVTTLGGRGGGRGDLAQGGGDRADLLDQALSSAARAVRGDAAGA